MRKYKFYTFVFILFGIHCYAQPIFFEKKFGTPLQDASRSIVQLSSGSLFMLGNSASGNLGNGDISLIKIDKYGIQQWVEYYGDENLNYGYSINKCSDGNLIIVGDALVTSNDTDVLIYKVDTSGNVQWQYIYSTPLNESAKYIEQTMDGGFIAAGFQTDTFGYNNSFVLKLDASGHYLWEKSIGGIDNDYASMIKELPGGNLILTSDTKSFGAGGYDVMLTKLDATGNLIWEYTYGDAYNNGCQGIYYTADNHFISYGETEIAPFSPFDMFMEKIDTNGTSIWKKYFGNSMYTDACFSICESFDGGFMLTGYSNSFNSGAPIDLVVLKTDANGNQIWGRGYGGGGVDIGYQIIPSLDDGYYITGKYYDVNNSDEQYYLLHIDKLFGGLSSINENEQTDSFMLYPNPNSGNFYIQTSVETNSFLFCIYTIDGKLLYQKHVTHNEKFLFSDMPLNKGFYIVEIQIGDKVYRKKMLVD